MQLCLKSHLFLITDYDWSKSFHKTFYIFFFLSIPEMTHLYPSEIANKNVCVVKINLICIDMSPFIIHSTNLANAHFEVSARQLKSFVWTFSWSCTIELYPWTPLTPYCIAAFGCKHWKKWVFFGYILGIISVSNCFEDFWHQPGHMYATDTTPAPIIYVCRCYNLL